MHIEALGVDLMPDVVLYQEPPLTTILEARKLLGRRYSRLDDTQVLDLINMLTQLARSTLEVDSSNKA